MEQKATLGEGWVAFCEAAYFLPYGTASAEDQGHDVREEVKASAATWATLLAVEGLLKPPQ